jgi:hypothetical protein
VEFLRLRTSVSVSTNTMAMTNNTLDTAYQCPLAIGDVSLFISLLLSVSVCLSVSLSLSLSLFGIFP